MKKNKHIKKQHRMMLFFLLEAVTGFEPMVKVLQTSALPLGYTALKIVTYILYQIREKIQGFYKEYIII